MISEINDPLKTFFVVSTFDKVEYLSFVLGRAVRGLLDDARVGLVLEVCFFEFDDLLAGGRRGTGLEIVDIFVIDFREVDFERGREAMGGGFFH